MCFRSRLYRSHPPLWFLSLDVSDGPQCLSRSFQTICCEISFTSHAALADRTQNPESEAFLTPNDCNEPAR